MRRSSFATAALLILLSLSSMASVVIAAGNESTPPSDGSSVTITDQQLWSSEGELFDGEVIIANGGSLTITGNVSVEDEAQITVQDGGTLEIKGAEISSINAPNSLKLFAQDGRISVPLDGQGGEVSITISFSESLISYAPFVGISGQTPQLVNGDEILVNYSAESGEENVWVNLTHNPSSIPIITTASVENDAGVTKIHNAAELVSEGLYYCCVRTWSIDIEEGGSALLDSGKIVGSNILVAGQMQVLNTSSLFKSGPVVVSDSGSLSVIDSMVTGSMDDEDVILGWNSEITWQNSTGTGGFVDHWIVIADAQTIHVPIQSAGILASGLGWLGLTKQGTSDEFGNFEIVMPERIISLQDSAGNSWNESATLLVVWDGPWGNISSQVSLTPEPLTEVQLDLPSLAVTSVSVNRTEASVNKPITVTVEVSNNGLNGAEDASLDCVRTNGEDARISPAFPQISVGAGQTSEVSFTWRGNVEGNYGLSCSLLEPNEWLGTMSPSVDTETVSWKALVNADDGNGMVIALISAAVIGAVMLGVLSQKGVFSGETTEVVSEEEKEYLEVEEEVEEEEEKSSL